LEIQETKHIVASHLLKKRNHMIKQSIKKEYGSTTSVFKIAQDFTVQNSP
jgi:hypothetical protein